MEKKMENETETGIILSHKVPVRSLTASIITSSLHNLSSPYVESLHGMIKHDPILMTTASWWLHRV